MPQAVPFLTALGTGIAATFGVTVGATLGLAIGVTTVIGAAVTFRRAQSLKNPEQAIRDQSLSLVVRSTETWRNGVYGEALCGGVITHSNVAGVDRRELYYEVVHTGHEIDAFVEWRLENKAVPIADVDDINASPPGDGSVDADTNSHGLSAVQGTPLAYLRGHLGASGQAVDSMLDSTFTEITSAHRHRGRAKTVARFDLLVGAEPVWDGRPPVAPAAVLRGKKVYDPREDVGLSPPGTHDLSDPTTWEWSDNPALCLADYLIDSDLGPGIDSSRIDYASVIVAADACDDLVEVPPVASPANTEKRFTCNLTYHTGMEYAEVIQQILDTMSGRLQYFNGQFRIYAGVWESASFSLTEDDLIGPYTWQKEPSTTRGDRYNQVRGSYIDPDRGWKVSQFLTVNDTTLRANRDNDRVLPIELDMPGVTGEYQAQRIAFRALYQADQTGVLEYPIGYQGCNIRVGDTGTVTLADLSFSAKTFRCVGVRYLDMAGIVLTLKEDASENYEDPDVGDYGTRTAAGDITFPRLRFNMPRVGDSVIGDAYFQRSVELPSSADADWNDYYWFTLDTTDADVSIALTGGATGGVCVIDMDDGEQAYLFSAPKSYSATVEGDEFLVTCRMRKTTSATVTDGRLEFRIAGWDDPPSLGAVSLASVGTLLDETDINAWTVNEWQIFREIGTAIGTADFLALVGVRLFVALDSGTELRLEIDSLNLTRVSSL